MRKGRNTSRALAATAVLILAGSLVTAGSAQNFTSGAARKPALSIVGARAQEGNSGSASLSFTIKLSAKSKQVVSVRYATANGTATAPNDYTAASGTVTFRPGQRVRVISIGVTGDTEVEQDETLTVTLANPRNARIAHGTASGAIVNDDVVKARAGHFHGPISPAGFIDFDVSADGSTVSNLSILPYLTCNPASGSGIYPVRFGDQAPIGPDLSFTFGGTGSGITVSLGGKFVGDGSTASGTLQIHISYDEEAVHYDCDAGGATWAAIWKG
jgi:hypothetical protein